MIITKGLGKSFDDFTAVADVSLEVGESEVLALLGPNGAGKTTTVRMLTSILRPTTGTATVGGYDVVKQASQVRAVVGVLTEHHGLYNRMPAGEYLDFFGQVYGLDKPARKKRTTELLEKYGLADAEKRRIGEFSKGMRQKLALARSMLHNPRVLLLDEPTSAMDPQSARLVRESILKLRGQDRSVIICTHNLSEAEELADRIAIIRLGRIVAKGTSAELKSQMLGKPSYEICLNQALNGSVPTLPDGVRLGSVSGHCLEIESEDPNKFNPIVIEALVKQGLGVVSIQEVPQSLEAVYLKAMSIEEERENSNA